MRHVWKLPLDDCLEVWRDDLTYVLNGFGWVVGILFMVFERAVHDASILLFDEIDVCVSTGHPLRNHAQGRNAIDVPHHESVVHDAIISHVKIRVYYA